MLGARDNPLLLFLQPWRSGCGVEERHADRAETPGSDCFCWTRA